MVKNVYGVDEQGRGLRVEPDNVGVQYGLNALKEGAITTAQFLALNENVGGMDIDGNRTAARSVASVEAIERAFATGRDQHDDRGARVHPGDRDPPVHRPDG